MTFARYLPDFRSLFPRKNKRNNRSNEVVSITSMKNKLFIYGILPIIGVGFLGTGIASAHEFFGTKMTPDEVASRQQTMFQSEAAMLGVSVDDVKSGWAQGKSMFQIAQDHGITKEQLQQKMKDARTQELKTRLQALVTKGSITQAQADARLQFIQDAAPKGMMGRGMMRGFHKGGL